MICLPLESPCLIIFDGKSAIVIKHNHHVVSLNPPRALLVLWSKRNCFPAAAMQKGPSQNVSKFPMTHPRKKGTWNEVNTNSWHSMIRLRSWSASESKFAHLFYWFKRSRTDPHKKNIMHLHKQRTPTPTLHMHGILMNASVPVA